jgi:transposase
MHTGQPEYTYKRLNDAQWEAIKWAIPSVPRGRGRPPADDRTTLDAVLYALMTGIEWSELPDEFGSHVTAWRRYKQWVESGAWIKIWRVYVATLQPGAEGGDTEVFIAWLRKFFDGRFIPLKPGTRVTLPSRFR